MSQNYPFTGNAQTFGNDFAVNEAYPGVLLGGTETGALYYEDREVAGTKYYNVQNATFNKVSQSWLPIDITKPAYAMALTPSGTTEFLTANAGVSPITAWTVSYSVSSNGTATFTTQGEFNVRNYGAKGDGVTDDSAAIVATQTAAAAAGGYVYFPAGTYKCSFTPTSNVSYWAQGFGTVLVSNGSPVLNQAGGALSGLSGIRFSGLIFDAQNGGNAAVKMLAEAYADITFDQCIFRNFVSTGDAMVALGGGTIPALPLTRNATTSLRIQFTHCLFSNLNCGTREALLAVAWGDSLVESCVFENCTVVGAGVLDLFAYHDHVTVANCIFSGNNGTAGGNATDVYFTNGTHLVAVNCQHRGGGQYYHGYSVQNCYDVTIVPASCENILNGSSVYANTYGVWLYDNTGTFDGNAVLYTTTQNVRIGGSFSGFDWGVNAPAAGSAVGMGDIVVSARLANIGTVPIKFGGIATAAQYSNMDVIGARVEGGSWTGPGIDIQNGVTGVIRDTYLGNASGAAYGIYVAKSTGTYAPSVEITGNTIAFTGTGANPPIYQDVLGNVTRASNNKGYNPVGKFSSQPAVPASTVAYTNNLASDAIACIATGAGVTVSAIAIGTQATGLSLGASASVSVRVPVGQSITLTYAGGTPTWVWFGD